METEDSRRARLMAEVSEMAEEGSGERVYGLRLEFSDPVAGTVLEVTASGGVEKLADIAEETTKLFVKHCERS